MSIFNFGRHNTVQPYSLPDLNRRKKNVDYWISVCGAIFLAFGIIATGTILYSDAHVRPRLAFAKKDWRVSFDMTSGCEIESQAKAICAADPANPILWESEVRRDSTQFLSRYRANTGDAFWMGTQVAADKLKTAEKASASVLVLPKLNGTVQVWLDGVYLTTHDFSQQRMPLQLNIPKSRMVDGRPLNIALGVFPYPHQPVPEGVEESAEGFFTPLDADHLTRSSVFFSTSQHLIAVGLFLMVAAFLWSVSGTGRTRDYSVGNQMALLIALISLLSVDLSFRVFNIATYESIYFSLLVIEGILIGRFTWTILRSSRGTSYLEVFGILGCLIIPTAFNYYGWIEVTGVNLMTAWALPLTYLVCATAVAIRVFRISRRNSIASQTRRQFLIIAGVAMALTGFAYLFEAHHQSGFHVSWSRWLNIIILFGLVRVFTKSHQTKSSLIELSPSSSYHKQENLPDKVEGWLLHLDVLRFSSNRQVMSTILSHLWTISQLNDGVVIKADEGSLFVLFGKTKDGAEDQQITTALMEMSKCVKDLEQRLPIVFPAQTYSTSILFRAAAMKGALKPSWHTGETGLSHIPIWVEVESYNSIQATKDLLATDLDAAIRSNDSSIVVMKADEANALVDSGTISPRARLEIGGKSDVVAFLANRLVSRSSRAPKAS